MEGEGLIKIEGTERGNWNKLCQIHNLQCIEPSSEALYPLCPTGVQVIS